MAKIKNKAAEVAFKILWALVAKKAHFEDNVIEPLQNTISNNPSRLPRYSRWWINSRCYRW